MSLFLALGLLGCDGAPHGVLQLELNEGRNQWAAMGASTYRMRQQLGCFCNPEITLPHDLEIEDGQILSAKNADSGEPLDPEDFSRYHTVESLFDFIQQAIDRGAAIVRVEFDETFGYPREAYVEDQPSTADGHVEYLVEDLELGPFDRPASSTPRMGVLIAPPLPVPSPRATPVPVGGN